MKKKRVKGIGQKWKKGQSCVSNPQNTKFRNAAQGNFFQNLEGENGLTVDALAKHTAALEVEPTLRADVEDDKSIGKTFNTFATNFTTCTIPAFNKFFKSFSADSDLHKRMLAIHAAAQEYITEANLPETATSYACALMSSLEGIQDTEEDVAACLSLIAKVIRKVAKDVIKAKFSQFSNVVLDVLKKYFQSQNFKIVINSIGCLSILLRGQDQIQWTYSNTMDMFQNILAFTTHENADVRRTAQYNVSAILRGSNFSNELTKQSSASSERLVHPASQTVAEFILVNLKLASRESNGKAILFLLQFLQQVIACFSDKMIELCCGRVLGIMQVSDSTINSRSLKVFQSLFSVERRNKYETSGNSEIDADETRETVETSRALSNKVMLEALLNALTSTGGSKSSESRAGSSRTPATGAGSLRVVPGLNNADMVEVWLDAVAYGVVRYISLEPAEGIHWFLLWTPQLFGFFKSDFDHVHEKVYFTLDYIFDEAILKLLNNNNGNESNKDSTLREDIFSKILVGYETLLKFTSLQYKLAWSYVFKSMSPFIRVLSQHPASHGSLAQSLNKISYMIHDPDSNCGPHVEKIIGQAIKDMGHESILKVLPLQVTGEVSKDEVNYWLIPLLKRHSCKPGLVFYISYFLPLIKKCSVIVKNLEKKGHGSSLLCKTYEKVEWQLWSLLQNFAKSATDVEVALNNTEFAKLLCDQIRYQENNRLCAMAGLRAMLLSSKKGGILCLYAKNYLKVLCNLYIMKPRNKVSSTELANSINPEHRLAAFSTIEVYIPILNDSDIKDYIERLTESFDKEKNSSDPDELKLKAFFSLLRPFLPFLKVNEVNYFYEKLKGEMLNKNSSVRKAAFRMLEDIISCSSSCCRLFVEDKIEAVYRTLVETGKNLDKSSRATRLRCFQKIVAKLLPESLDSDLQPVVDCSEEIVDKMNSKLKIESSSVDSNVDKRGDDEDRNVNKGDTNMNELNNNREMVNTNNNNREVANTNKNFENHRNSPLKLPSKLQSNILTVISWKVLVEECVKFCGNTDSIPTRKAAYSLLFSIAETLHRINNLTEEQTFKTCFDLLPNLDVDSKLTPNSILIIIGLSYHYKDSLAVSILQNCTKKIGQFFSSGASDVIRSGLSFLRMVYAIYPAPVMSDFVENSVGSILSLSVLIKKRFRNKLRDIFASLIRRYGGDRIRNCVPEKNPLRKLITNLIKIENRKKREKGLKKGQDSGYSDDSDSEEPKGGPNSLESILEWIDNDIESDNVEQNKDGKKKKRGTKNSKRNNLVIREEGDEVVDLLDPSSVGLRRKNVKKLRFQGEENLEEKFGFKLDTKSNKFIISDDKKLSDEENSESENEDLKIFDDIKSLMPKNAKNSTNEATKNIKRKRRNSGDTEISTAVSTKSLAPKRKKFDYGAEFRAKKAGGDVTNKGVVPYAYVQLSKDKLNRRKKAKYAGQFKSLVRGAKKGAAKGVKTKRTGVKR